MAEVYSAGAAIVRILPSLLGFKDNVEDQLGKQFGRDPIEVPVKPEVDKGSNPDSEGAAYGGRFGASLRRALDSALSNIPKVEIDANSSPAERKLDELRSRLEALRDKRIGVDLSAEQAMSEARALGQELDRVSRDRNATVDFRSNAGAARADLTAFSAEIDRLDGRTANVDVDTSRGRSNINMLLTAGLALGPALIPMAAAISAAFAGMGAGIGVGIAGLVGVKSAFSGVGDAIGAADDAGTKQAANTGKSAAQQLSAANSILNAQDALKSAIMGVGQAQEGVSRAQEQASRQTASALRTERDARESVRSAIQTAAENNVAAMQRQEQAEQSLTDAVRTERDAQLALADARRQAREQIQDTALSLEGNQLSQRGAELARQKAYAALVEAREADQGVDSAGRPNIRPGIEPNSEGSGATLKEKQLDYDRAIFQQKQLGVEGKRLADQKAQNDKKGVDGTKVVQDAQQRLLDATRARTDATKALGQADENVTKVQVAGARTVQQAEQRLRDASLAVAQSRVDGQRAIAEAQQRVGEAQQRVTQATRSLDQATASAAESTKGAAAATDKFAEAMKKLTPAQRDFVNFYLAEMKPKLDELKRVASAGLLPGVTEGLRAAMPFFDAFTKLVGTASTAMGKLATEAGRALSGPFWMQFMGFLDRIADDSIMSFGRMIGNFFTGLMGLSQACYPIFKGMIDYFGDLMSKFAAFGADAAAGKNESFNSFLRYVQENGPNIQRFFENLVRAVGNIISALSGPGAVVLGILADVLGWIAALSPETIQALVALFLAIAGLKIATNTVKGVQDMFSTLATLTPAPIRQKLADIASGFFGIGDSAQKSDKKAGALKTTLKNLAKLGVVAISLVVAVEFLKGLLEDPNDPASGKNRLDTDKSGKVGTKERGAGLASADISGMGNVVRDDITKNPNPLVMPKSPLAQEGDAAPNMNPFAMPKPPKALQDAWDGFFKGIGDGAKNLNVTVYKWFSELGTKISNWFTNFKTTVGRKAWEAYDTVMSWFDERGLKGWMGRKFDELGTKISTWWENFKTTCKRKAFEVYDTVMSWFDERGLKGWLQRKIDELGLWWSGWWDGVKVWVKTKAWLVYDTVMSYFDERGLKGWIQRKIDELGLWWSMWWEGLKVWVRVKAWQVYDTVMSYFDERGLKGWIQRKIDELGLWWSMWWEGVKVWVRVKAWQLYDTVMSYFDERGLKGWIIRKIDELGLWWSMWWEGVKVWVRVKAWQLFDTVMSYFDERGLKGWIMRKIDELGLWWSGWWDGTKATVGRKAFEVYDTIMSWFDERGLKGWIMRKMDELGIWLRDFWQGVVDTAGRIWAGIKRVTADPINFLVQIVYGQGIRGVWGKIQGFIPGLPNLPEPGPPIAYASGGPVFGPGSGTSDDIPAWITGKGPARLSAGEHVLTSADVDNLGGHDEILRLRRMAASGALKPSAQPVDNPSKFLAAEMVFGGEAYALGGAINLARATGWAMGQTGRPYVWGGGGPGGYDCSGIWGALLGVLNGGFPDYSHPFGTAAFGSGGTAGFVPGLGTVSVGVISDAGGGIGHMAGSLGPLNVESRGDAGVLTGPGARGANNALFRNAFHLPGFGSLYLGQPGGGGGPGMFGGFDPIQWLKDQFKEAFDSATGLDKFGDSPWVKAAKGVPPKIIDALVNFAKDKVPFMGGGGSGGGNVESFRPLVMQALAMLGQPAGLADTTLRRMNQESTGNPRAINDWDSNAAQGWPTKGLMQMRDDTFLSNWDPRTPRDIWNPLSNIVSSMRYAMKTYGSLAAAYNKAGGYDDGGWLDPGMTMAWNGTGKPEPVFTGAQWDLMQEAALGKSSGPSREVNLHVHGDVVDPVDVDVLAARLNFAERSVRF